jgi:hypothetical protein
MAKADISDPANRTTDLQAEAAIGKLLYDYDPLKWLYVGWENDHPKSWTFMGGGLAPGQQSVIQYTLTIGDQVYYPDELAPDRQKEIRWYLREGYLPCPVSEWGAGPVKVEIQHFVNRILDDNLTAVYSRVRLTNTSRSNQKMRLNLNAGPTVEVPLSADPTAGTLGSMFFDIALDAGGSTNRDFVSVATGDAANMMKVNKVVNPRFEAGSQPTKTPKGWNTSGDVDASFTTASNRQAPTPHGNTYAPAHVSQVVAQNGHQWAQTGP